jgi:hypothetical protein
MLRGCPIAVGAQGRCLSRGGGRRIGAIAARFPPRASTGAGGGDGHGIVYGRGWVISGRSRARGRGRRELGWGLKTAVEVGWVGDVDVVIVGSVLGRGEGVQAAEILLLLGNEGRERRLEVVEEGP